MFHTAVVEDINDPLGADRVRVRVFGLHTDDKTLIPTESLPWAQVLKSTDSAAMSGIGHSAHGLLQGSWVKLYFEDSDKQYPVIIGSISGVPSALNTSAAIEETAMMPIEEIKQRAEVKETPPVAVAGACEANVDLSGFYSKFGKTNPGLVLQACCDSGISNPFAKIAILANVAKECKFIPQNESFKYSVSRFKQVFPSKTNGLTDEQVAEIVKTEESAANHIYGGKYDTPKDEGYKYRGRGFIQIAFKANYANASKDCGIDFIQNPDLINVPENSAKAAVKFVIRSIGGISVLNGFSDQSGANLAVTRVISGKNINYYSGIGAEILGKVTSYSKLGSALVDQNGDEVEKASPIGTTEPDGAVSDGLTKSARAKIAKSSIGFRDPAGKYPIEDLLNEPDTNRLTRRNTNKTIFSVKKKMRRTGIKSIDSEWSQPNPPYNAKYPYNRGYFSESGHGLEFDDTEGQERVSLFHKSGSFVEIDSLGNRTNKIVGSDYVIIEKNGYLYVDGTLRLTTGGNCNIVVMGNANLSVDGNLTTDVGGDYIVKAGGNMAFQAGGTCMVASGLEFAVDAPLLLWNTGASEPKVNARDAKNVDYKETLAESVEASEMMANDDLSETESDDFLAKQVAAGKITADEVNQSKTAKPSESDTAKPATTIQPLPANCSAFANKADIPEDTMLSQMFSLATLTTKVALPSERRKVQPNKGLSVPEIVCNLKQLAENCLDPIKERFPNMIITNTIRVNGNGSQHELGQAADTQYPGIAKSEYFEVAKWIKENVIYDQLLLEYRSGGNPWIHISFKPNPRRSVMTFMNHKKHADGLHNLG